MIIGIDPGVTGAIAALDNDGDLVGLEDMPTLKARGGKTVINIPELGHMLRLANDGTATIVKLEQVHSMPGQGLVSTFNFGMGYGAIQGVVQTLGLPMQLVTPTKWKKAAGLSGAEKDYARTRALQLFPNADLARKKDIGRADAILIARFG